MKTCDFSHEKILDKDHPEDSSIWITICSDTRQVGKSYIAQKIAKFLISEGYENVNLRTLDKPSDQNEASKEFAEAAKKISIVIDSEVFADSVVQVRDTEAVKQLKIIPCNLKARSSVKYKLR